MSDLLALEASVRAAVPANHEIAAGSWVIRISGGTTKRVNSANPVASGAGLGDVKTAAERLYPAHGLPTRFRITPLAATDVDAQLAAAGYGVIDRSWTMTAPLRRGTPDPAVTIAATAGPDWLAGVAAASNWSAEAIEAHRALLGRVVLGGYAVLAEDGVPLAYGGASIAQGWACLFDIVTVPAARGRGLARRLVSALLGWAAMAGAEGAVLQVLADNAPARRLYASLGFADSFPYHYRIRQ